MATNNFTKETYLDWYEQMMLMRRFEEKAAQLYGQQKIKGFCHLYIGQEAVVAGTMSALKKEDRFITAYRDHAHALACGIPARAVMAEAVIELSNQYNKPLLTSWMGGEQVEDSRILFNHAKKPSFSTPESA